MNLKVSYLCLGLAFALTPVFNSAVRAQEADGITQVNSAAQVINVINNYSGAGSQLGSSGGASGSVDGDPQVEGQNAEEQENAEGEENKSGTTPGYVKSKGAFDSLMQICSEQAAACSGLDCSKNTTQAEFKALVKSIKKCYKSSSK